MKVWINEEGRLICGWFALCENPADWATPGPADTGMVPVCQRCADKAGLTADELQEFELVMEE
jgi:hypothetical protein